MPRGLKPGRSVRQNLARATGIAVWPRCVARRHLPAGRCPSGVDPISDTATATFPDPPVPPTRDAPAAFSRCGAGPMSEIVSALSGRRRVSATPKRCESEECSRPQRRRRRWQGAVPGGNPQRYTEALRSFLRRSNVVPCRTPAPCFLSGLFAPERPLQLGVLNCTPIGGMRTGAFRSQRRLLARWRLRDIVIFCL